jgi:hypothetical protein
VINVPYIIVQDLLFTAISANVVSPVVDIMYLFVYAFLDDFTSISFYIASPIGLLEDN